MKKILLNESEKKTIISERERLIIESFSKTFNSIKRVDENEVSAPEIKQMEKQAFDFANSPEMGQIVAKIISKSSPEEMKQMQMNIGSMSEGVMCENDFSEFLNIAHKAQTALNEGEVSDLQNSIGKALSTFGVVNIMSMGMLPTIVGAAVDHFTGTNFLQMASNAIGSGGAAAALSVVGGLIGGALLWRLGKAISGEEVTGDTPLFEIGMNDGEDYERMGREVEYGINPYEEESEMPSENTYKVEVIGKEAEKDGGYKHRWVYEINANSDEEAEALAADKFNEGMKYSDIYLFSVKAIQNPTEDDIVKPMGDKMGDF
jgi:hypothetical protein